MANKIVNAEQLDSDLTSVAEAIRNKGGTTATLAFPQEFVSAIDAIETGGGVDPELLDGIHQRLVAALGV